MGPRLKRWITLVAILLIVCFAAGIWVSWALKDDTPPEDDDLQFVRASVPAAENGFRFVSQFAAGEGRLEAFDKCIASPRFQFSDPRELSGQMDFGREDSRDFVKLASLRAWTLFKEGKEKEAFDATLAIVRLGQQVEGGQGFLIHYMTGIGLKELGLKRLREILPATALSRDVLAAFISDLGKYSPDPNALVEVLKLHYTSFSAEMEAAGSLGSPLVPYSYSLKPNRTQGLIAQALRALIHRAGKTYAEADSELARFGASLGGTRIFSPNRIGNRLLELHLQRIRPLFVDVCSEKASLAATQLLIALKCYQAKNGRLPASLSDLVPEYFPVVPKDPFDGKDMKYSQEKKILWSVGFDLVDAGGTFKQEDDSREPAFKIEF